MSPTDRWPAILLHLQAHTWRRATDLAAALGVSTRTIYRDMQALDEAGVPIRAVPGKGYQLDEDYLHAPLTLTTDEAVVLLVGAASVAQQAGKVHQAAAQAAQTKLREQLPAADRATAEALQRHVHSGPEVAFASGVDDRVLEALRKALLERRTVRLRVASASPSEEPAEQTMNPYGLVRHDAAWHLIGYAHDDQRVRSIRLDRLRELTLVDATFERPDGYRTSLDAAGPLHTQTVRVLFAADVAGSVQTPSSVNVDDTETRPDGRLLMTLRIRRTQAIVPWLLSWGAHAHVLEPAELRQRIAQEARHIADQYRDTPRLIE